MATEAETDQPLTRGNSVVILAVCCTAIFMTTLDNTILNVALPKIGQDLHASAAELEWSVDSYIVCRAALLFAAAALGDRFGRRRCMVVGMAIFMLGSLGCGLSPNAQWLIGFRVLQAAGGALMTPASMGLLADTFTEPVQRAQAIGIWSAVTGLSTTAGPLIGGALVESFGWRAVFFVNIPIGLLGLAGIRRLPATPPVRGREVNFVSQFAVAAALIGLVYALISAPGAGWSSVPVVASIGAALLAGIVLIAVEGRSRRPLLQVRPGQARVVAGSVLLAICVYVCLNGFTFYNTLYLQEVRGLSPVLAGLAVTPVMVLSLLLGPVAGYITGHRGPRLPTTLAAACTLGAMLLLAFMVRENAAIPWLLIGYLLLGAGTGLVNPAVAASAVAGIVPAAAGVGAATTSTARQIGTSLGIALIGSIVFGAGSALRHVEGLYTGDAARDFTRAMSDGWFVAAGVAAAGLVVAFWAFRRLPGSATQPALAEAIDQAGG